VVVYLVGLLSQCLNCFLKVVQALGMLIEA
jgi:hypothetical protein